MWLFHAAKLSINAKVWMQNSKGVMRKCALVAAGLCQDTFTHMLPREQREASRRPLSPPGAPAARRTPCGARVP
jgi:hypothetical protein